jgi:hypothetical protein
MKLEFSSQIDKKDPNIKFHENPLIGSWVAPYGRTNLKYVANSRFSQFCEGA